MPLDPDSVETLLKVKRGTPARFVLLTKGAKVVSLVAYRRGSLDSAKRQAREAGSGDVAFGVVDGDGAALAFKLARADGFEQPPTTNTLLKAFLAGGQVDCKPTIEIVDQLPAIDDEPQVQGGPRPGQYRSAGDWRSMLAAIERATDGNIKQTLLNQAIEAMKAERARMQNDPIFSGDPNAQRETNDVHREISLALRELHARPLPEQPPQQRRPIAPQVPPRHLQPDPNVQRSQRDNERRMIVADLERRSNALPPFPIPYSRVQMRGILQECETDAQSDFGKVAANMVLFATDSYDILKERLEAAQSHAQKYIKDHKDPLVGKLPSRVVKRRDYCEQFLPQIKEMLDTLDRHEAAGQALVQTYQTLLDKGQEVPGSALDQLADIQKKWKLSAATTTAVQQIVARIKAEEQPRGYQRLSELNNPTDVEKAEHLHSYGCYTRPEGGTSDVRLIRNQDRSVAFAFKGAKGESPAALGFLQRPNGACAMREDLCSHMTESILKQTGLNLGFPKTQVTKLSGQMGALIEGIRGKSVDPEERTNISSQQNHDPEELAEVERCLLEIPEKITPKSLQNVVLFSTLLCQWDCKWGNLLVEGETHARPLDGGASFPTQETVDNFGSRSGAVALLNLTQYPPSPLLGNKVGQTLPQAQQPMDPETVRAVLAIDVRALIKSAGERRDELVRTNPELAPPPYNEGLVDNATLLRTAASIQATQNILRANPQQSLVEFATAYTDWWTGWIAANKTQA